LRVTKPLELGGDRGSVARARGGIGREYSQDQALKARRKLARDRFGQRRDALAESIDRAAQPEPRERTPPDEQPVEQQPEQPPVRARVLGLAGRGRGRQPLTAQRRGQAGAGLGPELGANPVIRPVPHARRDHDRARTDRAREHALSLGSGQGPREGQDQRDRLTPVDRLILVLAEHGRERAIGSLTDQPQPSRVASAGHEPADPNLPERVESFGSRGSERRDPPQLTPILARKPLDLADRLERT
jgi:hypothetical protein